MKSCTFCNITKPLIDFYFRANGKPTSTKCKKCTYIIYKEQDKNRKRQTYLEKKDEIIQKVKTYRANNKAKISQYIKSVRPKRNAIQKKRHATKLNAIPKWADLRAIEQFYINCPKGYEVDHIIPLQGKNVCGLHVLDNLQYLTVEENRRKGNRY